MLAFAYGWRRYAFSVRATPRIDGSFVDPDGPANLDAEVARVNVPVI